ncbi:MAG: antitoxin (DNA-binding transcriptional repressor) of toxin-antitoxin stability system [Spirosomataceae bacterium]|jgi:antitoxin (DNA-binding transcriptional repressor) of toxin-antitoxin stability system
METVSNIHQAKTNLSALIQKVLNGEKVIIARNNDPIVELIPFKSKKKERQPGKLRGKIKLLDGWEESDKEIEDLFYNSQIFPNE